MTRMHDVKKHADSGHLGIWHADEHDAWRGKQWNLGDARSASSHNCRSSWKVGRTCRYAALDPAK